MNLYLSAVTGQKTYLSGNVSFEGTNILESFFYCNDFTENILIPDCKNFLLDSGAFTFINGKSIVDLDGYIHKYIDFINRNEVKHYFELDIDSIVGFNEVLKIRKRLENETGVKPIPVWHKSRGLNQFKEDCDEFPYVAIGGFAIKEIKQGEYPVVKQMIKEGHKRGAKLHGLGFTARRLLEEYHFDSVDSTSWTTGGRFGQIYQFNGQTLEKYLKPTGKRVKPAEACIHNFEEWKKFSRYAETHFKEGRKRREKTIIKLANLFNDTIRNLLLD